MTDGPAILNQRIRFALSQLRARNGHHEFEHLCRHVARTYVTPNLLTATGPVAKGGDQGRDFESFHSYIRQRLPGGFVGLDGGERIVFACTLQTARLADKIKDDVGKILGGDPVDRVYVFCAADVTAAERHRLTAWAADHGVGLDVVDGETLAELLTEDRARWIAERYLDVAAPDEQPGALTYNDFMGHGVQAASVHGDITINHNEAPSSRLSGRLLLIGATIAVAVSAAVTIWAETAPGTGSAASSPSPKPADLRPSTLGPSTPAPSPSRHPALLRGLAGKTWQGRVYADPAIAHGSTSVSSGVTVSIDPFPESGTGGMAGKILFEPDCGGRLSVLKSSARRLLLAQKMSTTRPAGCTMTDATVTVTTLGSRLRLSATTPELGHVYSGDLPPLRGHGR
jgi:hypothetical protein